MMEYKIHFVKEGGSLIVHYTNFVPRVGDEIRIKEDEYYEVTLIVWIFDEPECPITRVNVGIRLTT